MHLNLHVRFFLSPRFFFFFFPYFLGSVKQSFQACSILKTPSYFNENGCSWDSCIAHVFSENIIIRKKKKYIDLQHSYIRTLDYFTALFIQFTYNCHFSVLVSSKRNYIPFRENSLNVIRHEKIEIRVLLTHRLKLFKNKT